MEISPLVLVYSFLSNIVIWFATKRHFQKRKLKMQDISISSDQTDLVYKNIELYQKMIDDIETRYQENIKKRDQEIAELEEELRLMKIERDKERTKFEQEIASLRYQLKTLQ